jgi:hypothetical protein
MRARVNQHLDSIMGAVVERRTVDVGSSCPIVRGKKLGYWPGVKAERVYEGKVEEAVAVSDKENNN